MKLKDKCNPFELFSLWFTEAKETIHEPRAMALSTVSISGQPNCRMVIMRSFANDGFRFYTNYDSIKAEELKANPKCALTFWWGERSVRIQGIAEKVSIEESDKHFDSLSRNSQLAAWINFQSMAMSEDQLEDINNKIKARFDNLEITRPDFWGGYKVTPFSIEFWQESRSRLHKRLKYDLLENTWEIKHLCPYSSQSNIFIKSGLFLNRQKQFKFWWKLFF
jgi:pyridoxamine 5'-phosphate oxidase